MIPTISISQSRTKSGDYCRSPNLGSRSPSLSRSPTSKSWNKTSPFSSTEFGCTQELCNGDKRRGHSDADSWKSDRIIDKKDKMALSAIMLSGGGNIGLKKKSSQRTLSDSDCENTGHPSWSGGDDNEPSRSWPGSTTASKCTCDRKSQETVIINVGGHVFETFKSTLKRLRSCKLANEKNMMKYYREDKGDYFFDRDPYAFNIILNYLRYGDLHLPTNLCGPALMREFQYWGVDESDIER